MSTSNPYRTAPKTKKRRRVAFSPGDGGSPPMDSGYRGWQTLTASHVAWYFVVAVIFVLGQLMLFRHS